MAQIDTDLYSRQIGTFGMATMSKLVQMKVVISGLRGLGVETAKNLILAGPKSVVLHDPTLVDVRDLGANFYLRDEHVGKTSRAEASASQLSELNPYCQVSVHAGELTPAALKELGVQCVVCTETPRARLVELNEFCRSQSPPVAFLSAETFGLAGAVFSDFGPEFMCTDVDGEEPKSSIVAGITVDRETGVGTVHTHNDKRHGFQDGDSVTFEEVQGMTALNGCEPRKIAVQGPYAFTVGDLSGFPAYEREGIVRQVKVPRKIPFHSYATHETSPVAQDEGMLAMPDLAKFGRSEQLHVAFCAVQQFREKKGALPSARDAAAVEECLALAKEINSKNAAAGAFAVESIEEDVVRKVAAFAQCSISPMAAFLGGVLAQEVVKVTGKYHPLHQVLYVDMFEICQSGVAAGPEFAPTGSRYDDQIAIFGQKVQKALEEMNLFVVGAGALGCEFLKSFAMLGACTTGNLTCTDMDNIEVSNLNRQFLFRKENVGKAKSVTACAAAQDMNTGLRVKAMEVRVGPDTEETFDEEFWTGLDLVVNALDNVQARLYVDQKCVWFGRPLLESGTLGTKANLQVVLPFMTQSYGDSQDPPEESIPLCTLKHFPNAIEHTIEWSRDLFQGFFVDAPQEMVSFLKDPKGVLEKLQSEGTPTSQKQKMEALQRLWQRVTTKDEADAYAMCCENAVHIFQEFFHDSIAQLLHTFPEDHLTAEGQRFWSGPKRAPHPISFDANDPLHLKFIQACANVLASCVSVPMNRDIDVVRRNAEKVQIKPFAPKSMKIKVNDQDTTQEGADEDADVVERLAAELALISPSPDTAARIAPTEFEKDDDANFHVAFMAGAANLRARNYKIHEADDLKVKMIAGKIIPAIATTTAMVTGLVSAELLKIALKKAGIVEKLDVEHFKNAFVNLALPLWLFSEPMPPLKTVSKDHDPVVMGPVKARPEGFTPWEKIEVSGLKTLKELNDYLLEKVQAEVQIISAGNVCLYNKYSPAHKKRLGQELKALYEEITKQPMPPKKRYLEIEVSASDPEDDVDVQIPTVKFNF